MNGAADLSLFSMLMTLQLMLLTIFIVIRLKLGVSQKLIVSTIRMSVQLLLIGFFLEFLFQLNNWMLNLSWFMVMIIVAMYSVTDTSKLSLKIFALPVTLAFVIANFFVVMYFNFFIVGLKNVADAVYVIAIGGMILGNSLRANVVGLGDYYHALRKDESYYFYRLSLGAGKWEVLMPFARKSFVAAINPSLASMATMGIVSLPGMMTGQILGGSVPLVAIKYQIAIMVAILCATVLSILLSIFFTMPYAFEKSGRLKSNVFKQNL